MIEQLEIINHESHKNTILDFSPGLNVFIGATDAGKSSAFRAANLLFFNDPLGDSMLPLFWKGDMRITGKFSNPGCIISRLKGKGLNHYQVDNNEPINAGAGLPPGNIPELIGMDEVNFQTQIDRAFLMFESPGERGRILNKIAGLDDIDRVMSNAKSDELRLSRDYQTKKALLIDLEKEIEQFNDIETREQKLIVCEQFEKYIQNSWNKSKKLKGIIEKVKQVNIELEPLNNFLKCEPLVKEAETARRTIFEILGRVDRILSITRRIRRTDALLSELNDLPEREKKISELKGIFGKIAEGENKIKKLRKICSELGIIKKKESENDDQIKLLTSQIVIEKQKQPKICSKCGQVIKNDR